MTKIKRGSGGRMNRLAMPSVVNDLNFTHCSRSITEKVRINGSSVEILRSLSLAKANSNRN